MLIARAPLRISFAGGGTDLPAYYEQYGGTVVSTTIDKYVYVHVMPNGAGDAQITSADYRTFFRHQQGSAVSRDAELALPRAVLREFGVERGLALFLASEVPPGTGLGSSSALAVALVESIATFSRQSLSVQQVAELACHIELERLSAPIGKQDQFAAAFGGLNEITFSADRVNVEPLRATAHTVDSLERRLLLFFTKTARDSAIILREQSSASAQGEPQTIDGLHRIKAAALDCRRYLESGQLDEIGVLLDAGWREKRRLAAGITTPWIDEIYETALKQGAVGGKITGAGGGGFLLLYCREPRQRALTESLEKLGLRRMDFHFEKRGVTIAHTTWESRKPVAGREKRIPSAVGR